MWQYSLTDDEFYTRLKEANLRVFNNISWFWLIMILIDTFIKIYRPQNISTNANNSFIHLHDQSLHKRDTAKLFNQKEVIVLRSQSAWLAFYILCAINWLVLSKVTRKRDRQTGLDTTRFRLLQVHHLTIEGVPFRVFDVALYCNQNSTPWCQRVSSARQAGKGSNLGRS